MTMALHAYAPSLEAGAPAEAPETDGLVRSAREHGLREMLRLPVNVIVSGFLFAFVGPAEAISWLCVVMALEASLFWSRRRLIAGDLRYRLMHIGALFGLSLCWVAHAVMLWTVDAEVARIAALMDLFTIALYGAIGGHKDWRLMTALLAPPLVTLFSILVELLWRVEPWPIATLATVATLGACGTIVANGFAMYRTDRAATLANAALSRERNALEERVRERTVELSAALAQANAASVAKSQFLATMSHGLRTPLNAVIGYAELLAEDLRADATRARPEDAERIAGAAHGLLTMVNDILDYASLDTGTLALDHARTDLRALLEEVSIAGADMARAQGNTFALAVGADVGETVTDGARLRQCVMALVSNACKFTHNGEVRVSAQTRRIASARRLEIVVSDTGPGITHEHQRKIFEPFAQADSSATRAHDGAGLGLAMARKLADLLGGALTLRSHPDKGASFTISLPLA